MDFSASFDIDFSNWLMALIGIAVIGFFVRQPKRGLTEQLKRNNEAAAQAGMQYAAPQVDQHATEINEATHRFTGSTEDISWTVEALALDDQDIGLSASHIGNHQCYTRWRTDVLGTSGGTLIAMHLPKGNGNKATGTPSSGFLAKITENLGAHALTLFVRTAFGATRSRSISRVAPEHHLQDGDTRFAQHYQVFGHPLSLLQRLPPPAREWLIDAHEHKIALLWDETGIVLTWPTSRVRPEQVTAVADYGVRLVGLMRGEMLSEPNAASQL